MAKYISNLIRQPNIIQHSNMILASRKAICTRAVRREQLPTVLGLSNHEERVESLGIEIGYVGESRCHESWKDLRRRYSGQRSR